MEVKTVLYCGVCTLPVEYCEFHPSFTRCQQWLLDTHPEQHTQRYGTADALAALTLSTSSSSRGGKAQLRDTTKEQEKLRLRQSEATVYLRRDARNKRKSTTAIGNLALFNLDLKRVAKRLAGRFACGASVQRNEQMAGAPEEVVLQGDFVDDLVEVLPVEFSEIREDQIDIL